MDWHASEHPSETLLVYADLVAWAQRTHAALAQAIVWREAIYRIFSAMARNSR